MTDKHGRAPDVLLLLVLSLLPLLFFWRLITPFPADQMNIVSGDFTEQYFPLRAFSAREWVQGRLPLWNPYLFGGQPALADIQSGALYPPHVLQALLLGWGGPLFGLDIGFPLKALEWQVILHFSVASVGAYLFGRRVLFRTLQSGRRARFGAVIVALVFTYSGYLTGFPVQQLTILQVSSWLPWLLWGLDAALVDMPRLDTSPRSWRGRRLAAIAWAGLAFALAILAGHPQTALYLFYLSLAYALFLGISVSPGGPPPEHRDRAWRRIAQPVVVWLACIALGLSIAAAQLLPTLVFISDSVRADLSYQAVSAGLPLNEFVSILYPGFFGGSPAYVGIAPLVLIAFALGMGWAGWRQTPLLRQIFFWAGAVLLSLLLAFGNNLFVYSLFYLLAPGFDAVRQQERAFLVYSFSAAMLAGYGAAFLVGALPAGCRAGYRRFKRGLRGMVLLLFLVTALYIYGATAATARGEAVNLFYGVLWHHLFGLMMLGGMLVAFWLRDRRWLGRWWAMALLAVWLGFNLFTVNWRFNLAPPDEVARFTPNGLVQFLQTRVGTSAQAIQDMGRISSGGLLPGGNSAASVYELQDLTGNTPLQLAAVDIFLQAMPAWRLWQLMNVRYVVDQRDIGDAGLKPVYAEEEFFVFEMGDPFDRAWLVPEAEVMPDDSQALARLAAADFDLRQTAILPAPLPAPLSAAQSDSQIILKKFSPTQVVLDIQTSGDQLLVLSQIYDPGWQARVDNQAADLLRVNIVQQGLLLKAGNHTVELLFRPASFSLGLVISALGLLVWSALLVLGYRVR